MTDENGIPSEEIREHYRRATPVYDALAAVDDHLTIGVYDHEGWYIKRDNDDPESFEAGFTRKGRCVTLANDYPDIRERIDRTLYAVTTYKDRAAFREWVPCGFDEDAGKTVWLDGKPMPGYGDLRGVMAWGDIDLVDGLKPQRGDLDDRTRETIEATLKAYIEEFATLYGSRDAVFALDSVGGAYVMGAPSATLPIAEHFGDDGDALARVMEAFIDRSNEWLRDAQTRIRGRIEAADSVIDPDWVNNCNRQYKAPLSLHKSHDAVVTPLDVVEVDYSLTGFEDVDDELVAEAEAWAEGLTATDYRECVDSLVGHLWPDEYRDADSWRDALDNWVAAEREREEREKERRAAARKRRQQRKAEMGGLEGSPITPFMQDVYDALDHVDTGDVIKHHASRAWDTGVDDPDKTEFDPSWRSSTSGSSCVVFHDSNTFGDPGESGGGYAVHAMALGDPGIDYSSPDEDLSGEAWRDAVDALRGAGYDVPVFTPEAGSQKPSGGSYDEMPYWAVRKAAVALGVLPEDAFIHSQDEDGGGYLRFPGKHTYNRALAAIEDEGLEHGREYMTEDGTRPPEEELAAPNVDSRDTAARDSEEASTDGVDASVPASASSGAETTAEDRMPPGSEVTRFTELDLENGGYGYWRTNMEGESYYIPVTNFQIEANSFLYHQGTRMVNLAIYPSSPSEEAYDLTVPVKVFNDVRRFRDNVAIGRTTTFEGGNSELNDLRILVGEQDAPRLDGTHQMGLHRDEWVTPNGVLGIGGWCESETTQFIERETDVERAWQLDPETHTGYDPERVAEMLELIPRMRYLDRFLPVMGWFYASAFRPFIGEWEGEFNLLTVLGGTGAGKTTTLETMTRLFGMSGEPKAADDTKFALTAAMAATNSIPVWFDEYKPSGMADYELDRFHALVRKSTKGGVETRGTSDLSVTEYHLEAPVVVSGEESIQGPAEERRSIMTTFKDDVDQPGTGTLEAYSRLAGKDYETIEGETRHPEGYDLSEHAYAFIQYVLEQPRTELKKTWRQAREHVNEVLREAGITLDDTPKRGIQTIFFGMTIYRHFADRIAEEAGRDLDLPSLDDVNQGLVYAAEQHLNAGRQRSHLDRLLDIASRAAKADYLVEGEHFTFIHEGKPEEELRIHLTSAFDQIRRYARDHDASGEDLLSSVRDYRARMRENTEKADGYITDTSIYTPGLNQCVSIHVGAAERKIDEFAKTLWVADAEADIDPEEHAHADAEPLWRAGPGYQNLTVKVAKLADDTPDALLLSGLVEDSSGVVDIIQFRQGGDDEPVELEEGQCYRLEKARMGLGQDNAKQVELIDGVTEVREVPPGSGTLDYADAGDNSTLDQVADGGVVSEPAATTETDATDTTDHGTGDEASSGTDGEDSTRGEDAPPDAGDERGDGDGGGEAAEMAQADLYPLTQKHVLEEQDPDGVTHDDLVVFLADHGVEEGYAEDIIEEMLRKGRLQEPESGVYRV